MMKALLLILIAIALAGCAIKTVMKDCEQINETKLWLCKHQYEVFR